MVFTFFGEIMFGCGKFRDNGIELNLNWNSNWMKLRQTMREKNCGRIIEFYLIVIQVSNE